MKYVHVSCPCGEIRGIGKKNYIHFKGIRYAAAERWEKPVRVTRWEGCYDATVPGDYCWQRDAFPYEKTVTSLVYTDDTVEKIRPHYSEDCLNLNICAPYGAKNAPVLVYIHGGSYNTGGGGSNSFNGEHYCERGAIEITINYRLNVFASAYGDGIKGNFGLWDQICALEWIRDNIEAFGGDPSRVTIMGESAGAMSVQHLIYAPQAKGLFCGAIMLSGCGNLKKHFDVIMPDRAEEFWGKFKKHFGAATVHELRSIPPEELYLAWMDLIAADIHYGYISMPVVNGDNIPALPEELEASGNVNAVPCIASVMARDMFPAMLYDTAVEWGLAMEKLNVPVYGMFFNRALPGSPYGAYHGGDTKYAFGTLDESWLPFTEEDYKLSARIIDVFTAFVRNGKPETAEVSGWKAISKENPQFMFFSEKPCELKDVPVDELKAFQALKKPFPGM